MNLDQIPIIKRRCRSSATIFLFNAQARSILIFPAAKSQWIHRKSVAQRASPAGRSVLNVFLRSKNRRQRRVFSNLRPGTDDCACFLHHHGAYSAGLRKDSRLAETRIKHNLSLRTQRSSKDWRAKCGSFSSQRTGPSNPGKMASRLSPRCRCGATWLGN